MTSILIFKHFVENPHCICSAAVGCYANRNGCHGDCMRFY